jgi:hypothetical protein
MSNTTPSIGKILQISLLLIGGFSIYLIYGSNWYWRCKAQLDPINLMPITCQNNNNKIKPECKERLWPDFGECNDTYEGLSEFWGDDLISKFFATLGNVAGDAVRPILRDTVVPTWNRVFLEEKNRDFVAWSVGAVPLAMIGLLTADIYKLSMNKKTTDK